LTAPAAELGLPAAEWPVPFDVELELDRTGEQIHVHARVATATEEECARCLTRCRVPLEFEFRLIADRQGAGGMDDVEPSEDDDVVFHDGRALDLDVPVREAAILARPMAPLCRPDCKGLCPQCGADRNEGPCAHSEESHGSS
jgi:uncharacterized protein